MRGIVLALVITLLSVGVAAQDFPDAAVMSQLAARIGLTEEETEALLEVFTQTETEIKGAALELDVYKAQLARLLFPPEVNMREVEELLRKSYEWQLKRQLAQIRRQVEIRRLLGEDRWIRYSRLSKNMRTKAVDGAAQNERPENAKSSGSGR